MAKSSLLKKPSAIITLAKDVPTRCPALWDAEPTRAYESGGVIRLTCPVCGWTERYLVTDAV